MIEDFSAKPTASIPQACGDWTDTQAAYRFFENDKVDWLDILAPYIQNSVARIAAHDVVLRIQDVAELDFEGQKATGLGLLSYESQRGMYVHPTYAVSTGREPLGVLDAWMWVREFKEKNIERAPVLYLIVACRIAGLMRLRRTCQSRSVGRNCYPGGLGKVRIKLT